MKINGLKSENTKRAMSQLFQQGRVIVASDESVHVVSPKALEATDRTKRWIGGSVNILLDPDVTPYDLCATLEAVVTFLECELPSEDSWPSADVISS